jgi:hypothetical protein
MNMNMRWIVVGLTALSVLVGITLPLAAQEEQPCGEFLELVGEFCFVAKTEKQTQQLLAELNIKAEVEVEGRALKIAVGDLMMVGTVYDEQPITSRTRFYFPQMIWVEFMRINLELNKVEELEAALPEITPQPELPWVGNLRNAASSRTAFEVASGAATRNEECPEDEIQEVAGIFEVTVDTSTRLINVIICDEEGEVAHGYFGYYNGSNIVDQRWLNVCNHETFTCGVRYIYIGGTVRMANNATTLSFDEPTALRLPMEKWKPIYIRLRNQ